MKISYRREFKHNYLIVDPEELCWQGYESQMLSRNPVEGTLRFQIRQMDDGVRFYYEITSKQPLSRILGNRSIRAEEIRKLVTGIFGVLERMEVYLLREEIILLDPQYVYVDPDSFRIWLCLVPGLGQAFPEGFGKLLEYLLGSVDHQDKESVVLAYGLYQETRKENYGLEDLGRLLYRGNGEDREETRSWDKPRQEEAKDYEGKIDEGKEGEGASLLALRNGEDRSECRQKSRNAGKMENSEKGSKKEGRWKARWNQWKGKFVPEPDKEEESIPVRVPWEMMFRPEEGENGSPKAVAETACAGQGTALLADFTENNEQRMLRALDPDGTDIHLSYYPFIIGKQENLVDFILDRDTVSRLHLRIDRDGDKYQIKDLNSTNGTLLCGRLLENNEQAELNTGDEVCIARYRYRFE
ncbi:FHA domain-containing protein [Clostridiaceae bacterium]|nr:FHA domain-containing protein [Clostridiaceae bacterium]RKI16051.1 FHA domain-containing protein [bacterium 1XD21-70]